MAAAGRLMFLYPHLLRAATRGTPGAVAWAEVGVARGLTTTATSTATTATQNAQHAQQRRGNGSFAKRHGKGVEPVDWERQQQQQQQQQQQKEQQGPLPESTSPTQTRSQSQPQTGQQPAPEAEAISHAEEAETAEDAPPPPKSDIGKLYFVDGAKKTAEDVSKEAPETDAAALKQRDAKQAQAGPQARSVEEPNTAETAPSSAPDTKPADAGDQTASADVNKAAPERQDGAKKSDKLDAVFYMGAPENTSQQTPSLSPPKYVHHFDSYSLVKQLQEGGYSHEQAITEMKAIRAILAHNLDMALEKLVSKSDVANESYLFSAACSELSAEVKNNQRTQDEQMRQQRTHLQHEVDILTQSMNQELLTLTDNVREIFNDRKMAVREEQKSLESAIQKVNYKMSIMLSSDSKSEIEGLRWVLIRRSVLGIIFMAILTLGTLRYATFVSHEKAKEAQRKRQEDEEVKRDGGKSDLMAAPDAAAILSAN